MNEQQMQADTNQAVGNKVISGSTAPGKPVLLTNQFAGMNREQIVAELTRRTLALQSGKSWDNQIS